MYLMLSQASLLSSDTLWFDVVPGQFPSVSMHPAFPWSHRNFHHLQCLVLRHPHYPVFVVLSLACGHFSWCSPSAVTVIEVDNQILPNLSTPNHSFADYFRIPRSHLFPRLLCPTSLICSLYSRFLSLWSFALPFLECLSVLLQTFHGIFLLGHIWFLCNSSLLVLVLATPNNFVFLVSFSLHPFIHCL